MGHFSEIRPSRVAGSFYPGSSERLRRELLERLSRAQEYSVDGAILAAAVPHAGYVYSADVAAPVFKALERVKFDTIVIIGHDFGSQAPGVIAVLPEYSAFRTPLGEVPVDTELCMALHKADRRIVFNNAVHDQEHTIEVQLPFLQVTHLDFKIVPVLFGEVTPENCRILAELLMEHGGGRRIFVLSSTDLSHYPPSVVGKSLDKKTVSFAEKMDLEGLCRWQSGGEWEMRPGVVTPICSAGGLGTAMTWAKLHGANSTKVLARASSGDISGETDRCVGYASMLFIQSESQEQPNVSRTSSSLDAFEVPLAQQRLLLALARQTISAGTRGVNEIDLPPAVDGLEKKAAVFVTLTEGGKLRGCIGTTQAHSPLVRAVAEYAQAAAFQDPRFREVEAEELPLIRIEISVLSPMRRISSHEEIVPGKHGVLIRRGRHSGLFLPQVWEQLPGKEEFMGYLCAEKAGLPYDAWKDPEVELYVFTVVAFQEEE